LNFTGVIFRDLNYD